MMKNVKIIFCDNTGENKTLEENCAKHFEKIILNLRHQALHRKMVW